MTRKIAKAYNSGKEVETIRRGLWLHPSAASRAPGVVFSISLCVFAKLRYCNLDK